MSKTNIVKDKAGYLYVDTSFTMDHGWETMAFPCYGLPAPGKSIDSTVSCWLEETARWYDSEEEAMEGHDELCRELGEVVM